ncbi:MAG: T9SS type A sorting domain-containing protein, partial [Bacteroidota bacterium]
IVTHEDEASADGCSYTRTWTAMDRCGNMETVSQTISRADYEGPAFGFLPESQEIDCSQPIEFLSPQVSDNCEVANITFTDATIEVRGGLSVTRTWTATDACGNETTASRTITQVDNTAPVFTFVAAEKRVTCGEAITFEQPEVYDACASVQLTFSDAVTGSECEGFIQVERTWTAVDALGHSSTAKQVIVQGDFEAPYFTTTLQDKQVGCGDNAQFDWPQVLDNCTQVQLSYVDEVQEPTAQQGQIITRTYAATDQCGNVAYAKQSLFFDLDNEAPYFTKVPDSQTMSCGSDASFGQVEAADNCSSISVTFEDVRESGDCNGGYSVTRVWTATDQSGNSATASQVFTITKDETPPLFSFVPGDQSLSCGDAVQFGVASASDQCSNTQLRFEDEYTQNAGVEIYTRTWTAVDDCGNEAFAKQTITVTDNTPPNIVFTPADKTIFCGQGLSFEAPLVEDLCSSFSSDFDDEETVLDCGRSISRKWTFTDENNNQAFATQTITVLDNIAPTFVEVPASQSFACGATLEIPAPVVTDDCSEVTISYEDEAIFDDCSSGYAFRRVWTAMDACGNVSMASQEFSTPVDETPPVFTTTLEDRVISCTEELVFEQPGATDACGSVSLKFDDERSGNGCETIVERTWVAQDPCGNVASLTQRVRIVDNEPPLINLPAEMWMTMAEQAAWSVPEEQIGDDCSQRSVEVFSESETVDGQLLHRYEIVATDACGNAAAHTVVVYITDFDPDTYYHLPDEKGTKDQQKDAGKDEGPNRIVKGLTPEVNATVVGNEVELLLSPNPTKGAMDFYFSAEAAQRYVVDIYDVAGQRWQQRWVDAEAGLNKVQMDLTTLPNGTYFLQLTGAEEVRQVKFVRID